MASGGVHAGGVRVDVLHALAVDVLHGVDHHVDRSTTRGGGASPRWGAAHRGSAGRRCPRDSGGSATWKPGRAARRYTHRGAAPLGEGSLPTPHELQNPYSSSAAMTYRCLRTTGEGVPPCPPCAGQRHTSVTRDVLHALAVTVDHRPPSPSPGRRAVSSWPPSSSRRKRRPGAGVRRRPGRRPSTRAPPVSGAVRVQKSALSPGDARGRGARVPLRPGWTRDAPSPFPAAAAVALEDGHALAVVAVDQLPAVVREKGGGHQKKAPGGTTDPTRGVHGSRGGASEDRSAPRA